MPTYDEELPGMDKLNKAFADMDENSRKVLAAGLAGKLARDGNIPPELHDLMNRSPGEVLIKTLSLDPVRDSDGQKNNGRYWDGYNSALADLLENARGKGSEKEKAIAEAVAEALEKENKERQKDVRLAREKDNQSPEDRILSAMAALLEDAKGKDSAHQEAMAKAAASITESVKGIKEIRAHEHEKVKERQFDGWRIEEVKHPEGGFSPSELPALGGRPSARGK